MSAEQPVSELFNLIMRRSAFAENGCLEWAGQLNDSGYGRVNGRRFGLSRNVRVHRFVYSFLSNSRLSSTEIVMHVCDNRRCVRFEHLRVGTNLENMRDMYSKGRGRYGKSDTLEAPAIPIGAPIEFQGKRQAVSQWAKDLKIHRNTLYYRIWKLHWPIEKALLLEPIR